MFLIEIRKWGLQVCVNFWIHCHIHQSTIYVFQEALLAVQCILYIVYCVQRHWQCLPELKKNICAIKRTFLIFMSLAWAAAAPATRQERPFSEYWILNCLAFINIKTSFTNHNRLNHTSWQCTEQRTRIPPSSQSGFESSPALSKDQSLRLYSLWFILFLGWAGHGCPELPLMMKSLSAFKDGQMHQFNVPGFTNRKQSKVPTNLKTYK